MRCTPLHLSLPFLLSADKLPLHTYTPTVQEWVIHAWLLHSPFDWMGRRIHVGHHQRPYFHVSRRWQRCCRLGMGCVGLVSAFTWATSSAPCCHVGARPCFWCSSWQRGCRQLHHCPPGLTSTGLNACLLSLTEINLVLPAGVH